MALVLFVVAAIVTVVGIVPMTESEVLLGGGLITVGRLARVGRAEVVS